MAAPGFFLLVGGAEAGVVTFDYTYEYTGGATPAGAGPWLRATFEEASPGQVRLTLEDLDLSRSEFVSTWLFNLDPRLDPEGLSITSVGGLAPSVVRAGADDFRRGGARFDVRIDFPTRNGPSRFGRDDRSEFLISWTGGKAPIALTPESFGLVSAGRREIYATAHVQGIGCGDDSGWVAATATPETTPPVPEPGTLLLLGSGALGLAGLRPGRRRR